MTRLEQTRLHASLRDPVLSSMNLLNEITSLFPDAISFGPGAPYEGFFDGVDVGGYVDRYLEHLDRQAGLSPVQARRMLFQYGPARGQITDLVCTMLRKDHRIDVPAESVVITAGCQEAIFITLRTLFRERSDTLLVMDPCYSGIVGAARLLDIDVVPISTHDTGTGWDGLRRVCDRLRRSSRNPAALYLIPDFANPSGSTIDFTARLRLLDLADELDLLILEDNPYGFAADPAAALPSLKSLDHRARVLHVGTFAKIFLPGVRIGYVVADQPVCVQGQPGHYLAQELATVKSMITVNTASVSQAVVAGILLENDCSLRLLTERKAAFYRANLAKLLDCLDREVKSPAGVARISWNQPGGGFFVVLRLPFPANDELLELSAREYGVLWVPMSHFYLQGGFNEIRLSCSNLTEEQIDEGVGRLADFLADQAN